MQKMMECLDKPTRAVFEATKPLFKVDVAVAQHLLPHLLGEYFFRNPLLLSCLD
jgi:hypothetical protein